MSSAPTALRTAFCCVLFSFQLGVSAHGQTCAEYADCLPLVGSALVQWGAEGVAVAGDYAYVAAPFALQILNIADPSHPTLTGILDINNYPVDLVVEDGYVYLIARGGFHVIDVSNPSSPVLTGSILWGEFTIGYGIAVSGHIAYLAAGPQDEFGGYFSAVDVSNPYDPSYLDTEVTSGSARDVALSGDYAYVADNGGGLVVMSIMPPGNVDRVATLSLAGPHRGVAVSGSHVYMASATEVHVIDISDPLHPARIAGINTPDVPTNVVTQGTQLYVADILGLVLIDISNPASPALTGSTGRPCADVAVAGSLAYVVGGQNLDVVDVSNPGICPRAIGTLDTPEAMAVVVRDGHYAYVGDYWSGLQVIDITDPSDPWLVGEVSPGPILDLAVVGGLAYAACGTYGLYVINIANPSAPQLFGYADTPGAARGVAVAGRYAYIADDAGGLKVIDILNPTSPVIVGSLVTGGEARTVAVRGNYAYVGESAALQVVDISDPHSPAIAASLSASAYDVTIDGDYAYLAGASIGLHIADISNPQLPLLVGTAAVAGFAYGVAVDGGGHAYLASYRSGLHVLDVSNPAAPQVVGGIDTPDRAMSVTVLADHAFVADSNSGLLIYPAQCVATASVPDAGPIELMRLHEPTPNPFTHLTTLTYEVRVPSTINGRVHDVSGRLVRLLERRTINHPGSERLSWDGRDDRGRLLPAGVYFLTLSTGEWEATRRIVLVR